MNDLVIPGDAQAFRTFCRQWIADNAPDGIKGTMQTMDDAPWGGRNASFASEDQRLWFERMKAMRWVVPDWQPQYGGAGLDSTRASILKEELRRAGCRPPLSSFGIAMLAPVLFKYATEEQRLQHLPAIASGEIRWCQGYSEPGAGSDLAGLQTRAVRDRESYIVNGRKIWTSYANKSDWIFCLVRTNPDVPKHQGISFLLIDMQSEGVQTQPIRLISGQSPFCETILDDVRVPASNLIGEEGRGWEIAKYLLGFERGMIANASGNKRRNSLYSQARKLESPVAGADLLSRAANADIEENAVDALVARVQAGIGEGKLPPSYASLLKLAVTENNQRRLGLEHELSLRSPAVGEFDESHQRLQSQWLRSRANTIEGGSSEIQMNIIAKRILELP